MLKEWLIKLLIGKVVKQLRGRLIESKAELTIAHIHGESVTSKWELIKKEYQALALVANKHQMDCEAHEREVVELRDQLRTARNQINILNQQALTRKS